MEDILGDDLPIAPARLFERLSQVPNYTWDRSVCAPSIPFSGQLRPDLISAQFVPFHTSYDHW
jgi:hypothetical protein